MAGHPHALPCADIYRAHIKIGSMIQENKQHLHSSQLGPAHIDCKNNVRGTLTGQDMRNTIGNKENKYHNIIFVCIRKAKVIPMVNVMFMEH